MARGKMQSFKISAEPSMDKEKNGWTHAKAKAVTYQRHTGRQERPDRSGCSTCRRCTAHTTTSSERCSWAGSSQVGMVEVTTSQPHSSDQGDSGHLAMIYNMTDAQCVLRCQFAAEHVLYAVILLQSMYCLLQSMYCMLLISAGPVLSAVNLLQSMYCMLSICCRACTVCCQFATEHVLYAVNLL